MVVHGPYPDDPRVARESRAAFAAGWEVDVVASREPGETGDETVEGVRVIRLPIAHKRGGGTVRVATEYVGFAVLAAVQVAWRSLRRRYDVVQVHNPPDFLIAAALVPRLLGARVVLDVHDLSSDMFEMRFGGRGWARVIEAALRWVERAATAFAHRIITVHEPYRRELVARGVPREKITVVMNSLDETLLPSPGARESHPSGFRVVYHGTVTPHYGVDLALEAFAEVAAVLPDARLDIYGAGDAVPRLKLLARERNVADRVAFSERYLPQGEVLREVRGASVGLIPNRPTRLNRYALSSKLFEYVALGIPAVVADLPTLREHFTDNEVLFFRAGDIGSLAEALLESARDPGAAQTRAEAARRRYEAYRWPVSARRYVELLDRLAAS